MLGRAVAADALPVPRAAARLPQPRVEGVVRDVVSIRTVLPYRRSDVQVTGPLQTRKVRPAQVESAALPVGGLIAAVSRALAVRDALSARHDGNIGTWISGSLPAAVVNPAPAAPGVRPIAAFDAAHLRPPRSVDGRLRITVALPEGVVGVAPAARLDPDSPVTAVDGTRTISHVAPAKSGSARCGGCLAHLPQPYANSLAGFALGHRLVFRRV
jgi:hypothetical protein